MFCFVSFRFAPPDPLVILYECVWGIADIVQNFIFFSRFLNPPSSPGPSVVFILVSPFFSAVLLFEVLPAAFRLGRSVRRFTAVSVLFCTEVCRLVVLYFYTPDIWKRQIRFPAALASVFPGNPVCRGCLPFLYIKVFAIILWPESLFFWT